MKKNKRGTTVLTPLPSQVSLLKHHAEKNAITENMLLRAILDYALNQLDSGSLNVEGCR